MNLWSRGRINTDFWCDYFTEFSAYPKVLVLGASMKSTVKLNVRPSSFTSLTSRPSHIILSFESNPLEIIIMLTITFFEFKECFFSSLQISFGSYLFITNGGKWAKHIVNLWPENPSVTFFGNISKWGLVNLPFLQEVSTTYLLEAIASTYNLCVNRT